MLRKVASALFLATSVLCALDACTGDDPVLDDSPGEAGAGADSDVDPDAASSTDDAADPPAGPVTVKVTDAFSGDGVAGVAMFATNPGGEVVSAISDDRGEATLSIEKGASVTARIDVSGQIPRLVSYADVAPGDALRIQVVPVSEDGVRVGAQPVPGDAAAGDDYRVSVCNPRSGYYGIKTDGTTSTAGDSHACRVGSPPKMPLVFYTITPGSTIAKYTEFAVVDAPDGGTKIVQAGDWNKARSRSFELTSPLGNGFASIAMLYQGLAVFHYEQQFGASTTGKIEGIPFVPDWERGLLTKHTQGSATAYAGSIVYEPVPPPETTVTDDPSSNLPRLTSVALAGSAAAPTLEFTAAQPLTDVTGVEVVLDNRAGSGTTETVQWVMRLSATAPASPLSLPALPPDFGASVAVAWTHARVVFIRNESNPSPVALRAMPIWLERPRASARLLGRYVFGLGTKVRVSSYETLLQ